MMLWWNSFKLPSTSRIHLCGDRGIIDFIPQDRVTPFIEEEVEVEEEEIGWVRNHLKEKQMEDLEEDFSMEMEEVQ